MKMQAYIYTVLALLAVCHALAGEPTTNAWGPVTNNVQMAINVVPPGSHFVRSFTVGGGTNTAPAPKVVRAGKSEVKAGEPFSLLVRIQNLSTNERLSYSAGGVYQDETLGLVCIVISPSGKDVSPSRPGLMAGSMSSTTAEPNQTLEVEFPLSQICKLEEIGTYKITASKAIWGNVNKRFVLTSNTLGVPVVPDK